MGVFNAASAAGETRDAAVATYAVDPDSDFVSVFGHHNSTSPRRCGPRCT